MNITCDSCQARYTISDEKVTGEGRVFKVQCKQCGAEIVVEGISEASATADESNAQSAQPWYYAVGQERQGPVSQESLSELLAAGTVTAGTYIWRDGMDDWAALGEIEELKGLTSSEENTSDVIAEESSQSNEVNSVESDPEPEPKPSAAPEQSSSDDLFSFETTEKAPRSSVHGRRDSSVLFSLDELSSFEEPRAQDPQSFLTETSGLIDIRGLANSHQAQADDAADNPFLSATGGASSSKPSFSLSYVPVVAKKKSPWPWVVGIAAILVIGVVGATSLALFEGDDAKSDSAPPTESVQILSAATTQNDDSQNQENANREVGSDNKSTPKVGDSDEGSLKPGTDPEAEQPAPKEIPADKPESKDEKKAAATSVAKAPAARRAPAATKSNRAIPRKVAPKAAATKPLAPKPSVTPKTEAPKPANAGKKAPSKGVNDLLNRLSGQQRKKVATEGGGGAGPKTLTSATVRSKVGARKARFKSCYKMQPNRPPTGVNVTLKFTIRNSGTVGAARVNGGGLTGGVQSCIRRALKSIRFPVFRDPDKKVTYPLFLL